MVAGTEHNTTTRYNTSTIINRTGNRLFENVVHNQVKFSQGRLPPLTYNYIYIGPEEVPTGTGKRTPFQNFAHNLALYIGGLLTSPELAKIWIEKPPETTEPQKINHALLPMSSSSSLYLPC
jgi:hypothetical protein